MASALNCYFKLAYVLLLADLYFYSSQLTEYALGMLKALKALLTIWDNMQGKAAAFAVSIALSMQLTKVPKALLGSYALVSSLSNYSMPDLSKSPCLP